MKIALTYNLKTGNGEEEAELDSQSSVDAIASAIESAGHRVVQVCVDRPLRQLVDALETLRPDLVFNIAEGRSGRFREAFYPALFEQLGLRYTGSDASTLAITLDKALTKRLLPEHFSVPSVVALGGGQAPALRGPVIVKPNFEGSSKGITQRSVATTQAELQEITRELLERYPSGVLIEEYVDGVDATVAWLERYGALAPAVYRYPSTGRWPIYDLSLKCADASRVYIEVPAQLPREILDELRARTREVMRVLGVRDIGRADFRVDVRSGRVVFLEVNALPSMVPGVDHELHEAAALQGIDVMQAIIDSALSRTSPPRHATP